MNRGAVLAVVDDLAQAAYAASEAGPDEYVKLDPFVDRILALDEPIRYVAAAQIAIDDAAAAQDGYNVDQQLARAQAYATLASVEQSRAANLIAWKQLQVARSGTRDNGISPLPLSGDEITAEIERLLGIEP